MRAIAESLAQLDIPSRAPTGGELESSLSLHHHKLILKVHCLGKAILYDPSEGSLNRRIPKITFNVSFRQGWTENLARDVYAFLTHTPEDKSQVKMPARTKRAPTFDLNTVRTILSMWATGVSTAQIANTLPINRHNATIRVYRVIVGEQCNKGSYEHLYRVVEGSNIEPLRQEAINLRIAKNIPHDNAALDLLARLKAGR